MLNVDIKVQLELCAHFSSIFNIETLLGVMYGNLK